MTKTIPQILLVDGGDDERAGLVQSLRAHLGGENVVTLRLGEVDAATREAILAGGKPLELDAITYIQRDTPNRNFVRFKESILGKLAKSFKGGVYLIDHSRSMKSRAGNILSSELVDHKGHPAFKQTLEVTAGWAKEMALDGLMDRFSIGWSITGEVLCTACKGPMFGRGSTCTHFPGDKAEGGGVVEAVITAADGVEVSAVTVPAVVGTHPQDIRAALSALRANQETTTMEKPDEAGGAGENTLSTLAATDLAVLEQRALAAERERDDASAALAVALADKAKLEADVAAGLERAGKLQGELVDALIEVAVAEGKIIPALAADGRTRVETRTEGAIRALAKSGGVDAARALISELQVQVPLGRKLESAGASRREVGTGGLQLTAEERSVKDQLGLSDEAWQKYNQPAGAAGR